MPDGVLHPRPPGLFNALSKNYASKLIEILFPVSTVAQHCPHLAVMWKDFKGSSVKGLESRALSLMEILYIRSVRKSQ